MKIRKKPVIVEAILYDGTNFKEVWEFVDKGYVKHSMIPELNELVIKTLEGQIHASVGDYIIKGIVGEFYPCKPDVFELTYDIIEEDSE